MWLIINDGKVQGIGYIGSILAFQMKKYLPLFFIMCTFPAFYTHANDSLVNIKKNHKITLSYSYNDFPFSYIDNAKPVGMVIDICRDVIGQLEKELNIPHIEINWVGEKQNVTLQKVKGHAVDMTCSAITRTDVRLKTYNFSNPYFITTTVLLSKKSESVQQASQLRGKTIAAVSGGSAIERINNLNHKLDYSLLMVTTPDFASALELLKSETVKMLANDEVLLAAFKAGDPENYAISYVDFGATDAYGLMMAKDSVELTDLVNKSLGEIINSGRYVELYNKWFMSPVPPLQKNLHMPMSKVLQHYVKASAPGAAYRTLSPE
ncbi:transporter substrate-binding domain-containing protein [Buttiauxella gaviniae]|nr:transporter substrate-binding domain-containing protein [Buttiauxella gaviniae]